MTDNQKLKFCSGFNEFKSLIISTEKINWKKLKLYHWVDNFLITHAGLSKQFYEEYSDGLTVREFMKTSDFDLENLDNALAFHKFFIAGIDRGGEYNYGGILWCDYNTFEDIPNFNQVFGHTNSYKVRHESHDNSEHYCIDTGLRYYLIYTGKGTMHIRKS